MLSFEFDYYHPTSIEEAVQLFRTLDQERKYPLYYSGGTEIITLGRLNLVYTNAVIDIKGIPECNVMENHGDSFVTGAALSLTAIEEHNGFPLLSKAASGVADHTARNKITVGGNICGQIFYREAVLPYLLTDSKIVAAGMDGIRTEALMNVFNKTLRLNRGEFLLQLQTDKHYLELPYLCVKKRQQWDTGYPLVTIAAIKAEEGIRVAFSGVCPFPFRSREMEKALNANGASLQDRILASLKHLPKPVLDDVEGSSQYRLFVLKNTLFDILEELEGDNR
ncbi:FAD binding domain-containing protein [Fictibacillus sp. KIGAM418]|uniref:FAD binding domain-containing protein n=1 Tax=Fictibacillus marinisediminis TaxID=2878389 RepID=A0A9X2BI58_9BACL|nr:FAD binding domain-containing protein [Fictibacillus marinisediminis]MCK6258238.1 FAD binding domain-containing protein [Fictibacillus marinisediminis]